MSSLFQLLTDSDIKLKRATMELADKEELKDAKMGGNKTRGGMLSANRPRREDTASKTVQRRYCFVELVSEVVCRSDCDTSPK